MHFILACDTHYFHLLEINCRHIRALYPDAHLFIYDYGLKPKERRILQRRFSQLKIFPWQKKIKDWPMIAENITPAQIDFLSFAYNSRKRGIRKRFRKYCMKRFPQSSFAQRQRDKALRFEYLLMLKIDCMRHASAQCPDEPMVFLDTDAILFQPIDEVFSIDADVSLTILDANDHTYDENFCFVFNSGVIYFNRDAKKREAFLSAWWEKALGNNEWLREQSSLVRLVSAQAGEALAAGDTYPLSLEGETVKVHLLPCHSYNFFRTDVVDFANYPDAKVFHFTGYSQTKSVFLPVYRRLLSRSDYKYVTGS